MTPYEQGYAAFQAGDGTIECPYEVGTVEHDKWFDGWEAASIERDKD